MSLLQTLFRKRLSADMDAPKLKPVLNAWDLTLLGIGGTIGVGIFVLPGITAATQAGPGVILSFILSGFACACAAMAYSELAASVGGCGSAYGYSYAAFGELIAWIIGWDLILEYGVGMAAVATGWSGYLKNALTAMHINLSLALTAGPLAGGIVNLPALLILLAIMGLLLIGAKQSVRLSNLIVFIKLFAIGVFIFVAVQHVDTQLWHPFMPFGWFGTAADGNTVGVLAAASVVFFAYVGFDAVSIAVEETVEPQRNVPIGILAALGVCTVLYIVVSALLTGIVSYKELNVASPVAHALLLLGINWATALIGAAVVIGLIATMLMLFYGLTRVIFAMARDGLLPEWLGKVNAKTQVPMNTTVLCGVFFAVMAGFVPLGVLAELVNIGTLVAFVLVCGGVIVMRLRHPNMPRPFRSPLGLTFPILGALSCGALVLFLPLMTHIRFVVWLAIGMVFYFAYSIRKSKLQAIV